ncbi:MAG: hypothetical protein JKX67_06950 [Colwellia sp.]|nr:hypothetical protein [Colwellia sp.]
MSLKQACSAAMLKQWMIDNKVTGKLLRKVLPESWSISDRSGSGGYGSRGITAVVWSDKRTPLIIYPCYLKMPETRILKYHGYKYLFNSDRSTICST